MAKWIILVQSLDERICERGWVTISELLCKFTQISAIIFYDIITG
jgi:hypothetical protein